MNNLLKVAALPGSGAGCFAALPAEKFERRTVTTPNSIFGAPGTEVSVRVEKWPTLEEYKTTVQMKAPYFDEMVFPPIDLGEVGGTGA